MCLPSEVGNSISCIHFARKHTNKDDIRNTFSEILCFPNIIKSLANPGAEQLNDIAQGALYKEAIKEGKTYI